MFAAAIIEIGKKCTFWKKKYVGTYKGIWFQSNITGWGLHTFPYIEYMLCIAFYLSFVSVLFFGFDAAYFALCTHTVCMLITCKDMWFMYIYPYRA
jgi:hypothetical protein